jgi:hypothetical protein
MNSKKIWVGILAGAALTVLSACLLPVGDGEGLNSSGDVPPPVTTLQSSIQPIFSAKCASCHSSGAGAGFGNLKLNSFNNSVASFFTISGTDTTEVNAFTTAGAGKKRIVRYYPDSSHLYERITSTGSIKMPPGNANLEASEKELIRQWIAEGARLVPPPIP